MLQVLLNKVEVDASSLHEIIDIMSSWSPHYVMILIVLIRGVVSLYIMCIGVKPLFRESAGKSSVCMYHVEVNLLVGRAFPHNALQSPS